MRLCNARNEQTRIAGMNTKPVQSEKGRAFGVALSLSKYSGLDLARELGLPSSSSGQTINNWKIRGVPSRLAPKVALLLNCKPGEISHIEAVDESDKDSVLLLEAKESIREEFLDLLNSAEDIEKLEALKKLFSAAKSLL